MSYEPEDLRGSHVVEVKDEDFAHARETCPSEAPWWMLQEFAVNSALRRAFPEAETIRVDRARTSIDGARFHRSAQLYRRRKPYRFLLSSNKLWVRFYDAMALLGLR